MATTVQLLALTGLLYAALSLFQLLNAHLLAGAVPANLIAPIAMISAGLFAAWLIGGAPAPGIKRAIAWTDEWLNACSAEIRDWTEKSPPPAIRLMVISAAGLSLFLELLLIRWESGVFAVFALYKNFALLSCFCGLGIGYAKAEDKQLTLPAALPMTLLLLALFTLLRYGTGEAGNTVFQVVPVREEASVFFAFRPETTPLMHVVYSIPVYLLLAVTFVLNVLVMFPVGQFCGHVMRRLPALPSYGYNLLGSIAGVVVLFLLSWAWAGPVIWFSLAAMGIAIFLLQSSAARIIACVSAIGCAIVAGWPTAPMTQVIYSPYQMIEKASQSNGLMGLLISGSYYQKVFDLNAANPKRETDDATRKVLGYYELPFKTAKALDQVAIVGAGSGNDIAAALRNHAGHVDAVEIDPAIRDLGVENHPEHPYSDPHVRSIINDARNFFRSTHASYDVIVYGVLDSHIVVSHGANMRVDSFVYTQEGLKDAFDHVRDGGLLSVSFALPNRVMGEKVFTILKALPDAGAPVAVLTGYDNNNTTTFMVSKHVPVRLPLDFMAGHQLTDITSNYAAASANRLDLPSDDWPFFYLEKKMYPGTYLILFALVLGISFFMLRHFLPAHSWQTSLLPFFFLGAGFMLVETKAITELGLLFGNTWQVIGIAIISVLVMAFLANLVASRLHRQVLTLAFTGLLVVLLVGYTISVRESIQAASIAERLLLVVILVGPLFFSGIVFSTLLKGTPNIASAMSYNLMGAMLGGVLEYNSMRFGFSTLYLIAFILYGLAWVSAFSFTRNGTLPPDNRGQM